MVTLKELAYVIEANVNSLNSAIPTIEKLTKQLEKTSESVAKMGKMFEAQQKRIASTATQAANAQTSAASKTAASYARQREAIEQARIKLEKMNMAIKDAGGASQTIATNTRLFNMYERTIRNGAAATDDFSKAKANFNRRLLVSQQELNRLNAAQAASNRATQNSEQALIRQENAVERSRQKYLDLLNALERTKASPKRINDLNNAFGEYEATLTGGVLKADEFSKAQNKLNASMGEVRRASNITHPVIQKLSDQMTDLSKSVQVALGPLSGVAARLTAFTSLVNRNTIAIASFIAGIIALGTFMVKGIAAGSRYEQQMLKINAVLAATGKESQITAEQIDVIAKRVGEATLTTQSAARDAAAALATFQNVPTAIYEEALKAAQGLSLIGRGDITSQIRRIGRILEDPAENLKALTESGVFFNKVQEETIKTLQEQGDLFGAQAEVMKRLNPVIAAATGETGGLAGAWDTLQERLTTFTQESGIAGGATKALTNIVNDLNNEVERLNNNTEAAIDLSKSYKEVIEKTGAVVTFLAHNVELLFYGIAALIGLKLVAFLVTAGEALFKLARVSGLVTLFQLLARAVLYVVGSLTTLLAGVTIVTQAWAFGLALAALITYQYWDQIKELGNTLLELGKIGAEAFLNLLPDNAAAAIRKFFDDLSTYMGKFIDKIKEAKDYILNLIDLSSRPVMQFRAPHPAVETVDPLQRTIEQLLSDFAKLEERFSSTVYQEKRASNAIINVEKMVKRLDETLASGQAPEEYRTRLARLRDEIEAHGSPLRSLVTDLRNEIAITEMQTAALSKLGVERATANDAIVLEQALVRSGLAQYVGQTDVISKLTEEERKRYEGILKYIYALQEARRVETHTSVVADLEDQLRIQEQQIDAVNMGTYAGQKQAEVLKIHLKALRDGLTFTDERVQKEIELTEAIADSKREAAYASSVSQAIDNLALLQREIELRGMNVGFVDEEIAALKDRIELTKLYGNLENEQAKTELRLREVLREKSRTIESINNIRNLDEEIQLRQIEYANLAKSAEQQEYILRLREAEFDLLRRFKSLEEPGAQQELTRIKALIKLEQEIDKTRATIETIKDGMTDLGNETAKALLQNELSWKSWKDIASSAIDAVIEKLLDMLVIQNLVNAIGGLFTPTATTAGAGGPGGGGATGTGPSPIRSQQGGILAGPQVFGLGSSLVKAGERGPSTEAIMPLVRGRHGLGVSAEGIGGGSAKVEVIINNNNPENEVTTQRRTDANGKESILINIERSLAGRVGRGEGQLAKAIERTYGVKPSPVNR